MGQIPEHEGNQISLYKLILDCGVPSWGGGGGTNIVNIKVPKGQH